MNILIYILLITLITLAGILSALLYFYKKQINIIYDQMKFINDNPTNLKLLSNFPFKSLVNLINIINSSLVRQRETEIKIERLNQNFKKSITSISHDIRTPLTSASGYIQMLNNNNLPIDKKIQYIKVIDERLDCVQSLLTQLFEFSRIESNEINLVYESCNINNILCESLSLFYNDFKIKNMTPEINIPDTPFIIEADKNALNRVFSNIISNALIHNNEDFIVSLLKTNNAVKVIFKNKTLFVTKDDIDNIFERFYKTDKGRSSKTTGLGLAISKEFIEKMHGKIYATYINNYFSIIIEFKNKKGAV